MQRRGKQEETQNSSNVSDITMNGEKLGQKKAHNTTNIQELNFKKNLEKQFYPGLQRLFQQ